jgi:signal transduction histidine kinase
VTSLSRRIIIATVALTAVCVGVSAVGVWMATRWQLLANLDTNLIGHFTRLTHLIQAGRLRTPPRNLPSDPRAISGTLYWRVINRETGKELLHSPSLDESPGLIDGVVDAHGSGPDWMQAQEDHDLRVMVSPTIRSDVVSQAPNPNDPDAVPVPPASTLVMAIDATPTQRELSHVAVLLAVLWVTACGLSVLVSSWLRRAILRPVHHLASAIRAIDLDRLPAVVEADVPIEMVVVRERLDDLLARLRQVLAREKGTIANIAHELRTPIAGLRTTLEFIELADQPGAKDVATRCLPTVLAMQRMVSNLLTLARIEAGQETVALQTVDLHAIISDCWRSIDPVATKRGTRLEVPALPAQALARTCPDKVRIVIANLLDNAVSHSPAGSTISAAFSFATGDEHVRLMIDNPCPGVRIDPSALFQPFWRGDQARGGGGLHCGLGLALCRRLVTLLGGTITVDPGAEGQFRITIALPRSASALAAARPEVGKAV